MSTSACPMYIARYGDLSFPCISPSLLSSRINIPTYCPPPGSGIRNALRSTPLLHQASLSSMNIDHDPFRGSRSPTACAKRQSIGETKRLDHHPRDRRNLLDTLRSPVYAILDLLSSSHLGTLSLDNAFYATPYPVRLYLITVGPVHAYRPRHDCHQDCSLRQGNIYHASDRRSRPHRFRSSV